MSITSDHYRFIVGVDTPATTHTYALLESPSGRLLAQETSPTTTAGLARAASSIGRRTEGGVDEFLISAEYTGSYGAVMAGRLSRG
ncbi:hypothetical protein CQ018_14895 [Arthrobacter sp. MYb227]|uniref:hypothetical protein n=1 Tax=Arthrobacter sp. MYb227 TaxID=1848601 RepID=UPI000CFB1DC0|nr:hypothetical protein [Arthrobacter sp. MYb227]PQZ90278.1 hypothetical protein CQ018_14895 [Arthrobacter sp. MYb227]